MNDFEGLLPSDYGFKPSSNKSAPISGSRSTRPASNSFSGSPEPDSLFAARSTDFASDILGGSARRAARSPPKAYDFDSVFDKRSNSEPVYDKPVYDDDIGGGGGVDVGDIFHGVPGIRSSTAAAATSSSKVKFEDVFSSVSSSPPKRGGNISPFDDLLGGFGKAEAAPAPRWKSSGGATRPEKSEKSVSDFDDLLAGFGASSLPTERSTETFANSSKTTSKGMEDPFVSTGNFIDPLEEISKFSNSRTVKSDSVGNGRLFDDVDPFDGLVRTASSFSSERENRGKETSNLRTELNNSGTQPFTTREVHEKPSVKSPDNQTERKVPVENDWDSNQTIFDIPTASTDTYKSFGQTMSPPSYASASFKDSNAHTDRSPRSEEDVDSSNDIWISVSEVPLVTQPTSAPPPSRPPPPKPVSKTSSSNARRMNNEFSSFPAPAAGRSPVVSPIDEFEDFVRGTRQDNADEHVNGLSGEEDLEMNSAAAAMKEAMDRAQAKFRQAKEVRERENSKATRSKEGHHQERDEKFSQDERARERQERLERQRLQREKEEEERERQRFEREREEARESEEREREREQRRIEKEKERAREIEKERERARQAVERATREARERAAADARQKAERTKAERAAVDKATNEARERAERVAVQRAQSEARERAAAEAKERAERANSEAKEKEARERAAVARAEAEARTRAAERVAVGRAAAEARERAAADARDRAAAAARASQQKNENDIESFFSSRASSAPRPSTTSSTDPFFDTQPQTKRETEVPRAPSGNSSNIKKASSSTNIVDDLSSIFGASAPASGDFKDREGETDERRRARLERHQRTQERAAKALAEKNQRDLQMQREQAETSRIGETLDVEIKRWAAGKEGNLRALLSTLQYVLWPESGWQAVSLTDLITAASVKKVYRKATLCIHPDKVQQKGANLQQKYVAGKVFDLLKEAWNKFNSEELF